MQTKHILFIITRSDTIGGAQIHVLNLSAWLISKGYKVSVIHGGKGILYKKLTNNGVNCLPLYSLKREFNVISDIITILTIGKYISDLKPDLISLHSFKAGLLVRLLNLISPKNKIIYTAHGFSFYRTIKSNFIRKFFFFLESLLNRRIKLLITVCKTDKEYAMQNKLIKKNKIYVIQNGVFKSKYEIKDQIINKKFMLITIARLEWPKDFKTLLKALSCIKNIDWQLTILGIGPDMNDVKAYSKELKISQKISFKGLTNDVDKYLIQNHLFILSSYSEGFPRSILKAMSNGLPIIASNVGGIKESVKHGENGYLFKPGDHKGLAKTIKDLYAKDDKRLKFGRNSLRIYEKNFKFEVMAEKTLKMYKKVLKTN